MKTKLILKSVISTCALVLTMTFNASAFTAVTSGLWSSAATWGGVAPGGTISGQDITIPSGITVTFDSDVTFSGLINSFTVNGTLSSSTMNTLTMSQGAFAGSGMVSIHKVVYNNVLATMPFTGTINVDEFENNGATISLASIMNIADTLYLNTGSIVLNTGSNLSVMTNSTIKVNNGSMTIGGGIFNTGSNYNALYVGSSKTTGVELNTTSLQNLHIQMSDNTQTVFIGNDLNVNADLHLNTGRLSMNGRHLTLKGDLFNGTGASLTGTGASSLTMTGTTPPAQSLLFMSGTVLSELEIDYSGSGNLKIGTPVAISGYLRLNYGMLSMEAGSDLALNTGSTIHVEYGSMMLSGGTFTGTASYNVEYMGGGLNSGMELTGSGLSNVTVNLPSAVNAVFITNNVNIAGSLNLIKGKLGLGAYTLTVNGSLQQTSTAPFIGTPNSILNLDLTATGNDTLYFYSSFTELSKLRINTTGGYFVLGTDLKIYDELDMSNGQLDLDDYTLTIASTGMITNYDDVNYIVITDPAGKLQMNVNSSGPYVTFPLGTASGYSPAYLQQSASGTSGNFMVTVMDGVYTNGTVGFNSATTESVVDRTWVIDEATGVTVNANIKLGWKASSEVNGFNRTNCYISHYNAGGWDTHATGAAMTGAFSTYETSRSSLTTLSPFSVADNNAVLEINEVAQQEEGITIYPNPSRDFVYIENANFVDNFKYEVVDVTGQVLMTISVANKGDRHMFDVTKLNHGYYFIRATNLDNKEIITKRFIKG
jgi:hypothetical protein